MPVRKKVLLVDDERAILKILGVILKISGYDVITALEGQEALELVKSAKPDLLLLDIIMPGKDGCDVLRDLRAFSELPVIAFSAVPENEQKALACGANDFMGKPFDNDELVKKIQRLLNSRIQ